MIVHLAYGEHGLDVELPDDTFVLEPPRIPGLADPRRAVAEANTSAATATKERRLEAFEQLQRSLSLTPAKAAEWQDAIRDARR